MKQHDIKLCYTVTSYFKNYLVQTIGQGQAIISGYSYKLLCFQINISRIKETACITMLLPYIHPPTHTHTIFNKYYADKMYEVH
jgi:hypothetical protein